MLNITNAMRQRRQQRQQRPTNESMAEGKAFVMSEPPTSSYDLQQWAEKEEKKEECEGNEEEHKARKSANIALAPVAAACDDTDTLLKRVSSMPGNLSLFRAHLTNPLQRPEFRAAPPYTRRQAAQLPANEPDSTPVYGAVLLGVTSVMFVLLMYALVVAKFMPKTGFWLLDAVKKDDYFCLLVPITGLSFTFAVFWNWLGMKFFRHN
ncbi:hypothetical protein LPJ66_004153 [Kickxella alabastrina]|uniref:Uncharacterized protein n=1 Tax=Kickxella alabastrina TaxID=61397 RepID=A0ACC1INU7_9FUNG|nr:hypothetical protein LPJ66_004153 [Kickxella alabastrina]